MSINYPKSPTNKLNDKDKPRKLNTLLYKMWIGSFINYNVIIILVRIDWFWVVGCLTALPTFAWITDNYSAK